MSNFVIISDTGCDLNAELRERFDIADYLRGVLYFPDGHEASADLDWSDMTPEEYFSSMKGRKALYKSAAPKIGDIAATFEKYLSAGQDILCICLSSSLSGTYDACLVVKKDMEEKYPDRRVEVIDSLRYSTSLALLMISAATKRLEEATLDETVAYVEEEKYKIHQMGTMDDLFFLVKTGRISNFKAFFGNMIGLNLLADFNEKGLCEVSGKLKGRRDALDAIITYIDKTIVNPQEQILFIAHSLRPELAKTLADMVQEKFSPKEIIMNDVGMVCGANIGPGLCACFYKGEPVSKDMVREKAIMDEICSSIKDK